MRGVYFISDGSLVKIGYSNDVSSRMLSLQTGNPKKLFLLDYFSGGFYYEKIAHRYFSEFRELNEWYNISNEQVSSFVELVNHIKPFKISNLSIEHFNLTDYKLWDYIILNKGMFFNITDDEVSDIISRRAFFKSKKKLIDLGLIIKLGNKKYTISEDKLM